jgi:hypothetical protein
MGYVPPQPPSRPNPTRGGRRDVELQREIDASYDGWVSAIGGRGAPPRGLPTSYAHYVDDLYGPAPRDWFPTLNALLGAALIALVAALGFLAAGA